MTNDRERACRKQVQVVRRTWAFIQYRFQRSA